MKLLSAEVCLEIRKPMKQQMCKMALLIIDILCSVRCFRMKNMQRYYQKRKEDFFVTVCVVMPSLTNNPSEDIDFFYS